MAEFAAATGAAGLISLGLQVCGGLIKYFGALKSRDEDLQATSIRLNGLCSVLEVLNNVLHGSDLVGRPSFRGALTAINQCGGSIRDMQQLLTKLTSAKSSRVATSIQKAYYPFQKAELSRLNAILNDLQGNLNLAVLVAQSDSMSQILQAQSSASTALHLQISTVDTTTSLISQRVEDLHDTFASLTRAPLGSAQDTSNVNSNHSGSMAKPAQVPRTSQRPILIRACMCRSRIERGYSWASHYVKFQSSTKIKHQQHCPYYTTKSRSSLFEIRLVIPYYATRLGSIFTISIDMNIAGMASASMVCRRIVSDDNQAFQLLETLTDEFENFGINYNLRSIEWYLDLLILARRCLAIYFATGEVFARDATERHPDLFHIAGLVVQEMSSISGSYSLEPLEEQILGLLADLESQGVRSSQADNFLRSKAVDSINIHRYFEPDERSYLLSSSLEIALRTSLQHPIRLDLVNDGHYTLLKSLDAGHQLREHLDLSDLEVAAADRSTFGLRKAIVAWPRLHAHDAVYARSILVNACILSHDWIEGLTSLASLLPQCPGLVLSSAVARSLMAGCFDCVEVLAMSPTAILEFFLCFKTAMAVDERQGGWTTTEFLIVKLAAQRRDLRTNALKLLPLDEHEHHGICADASSLPDSRVADLTDKLAKLGASLSHWREVSNASIWSYCFLEQAFDRHLAQFIWEAGWRKDLGWYLSQLFTCPAYRIREATEQDFQGRFELGRWLIDHRDSSEAEERFYTRLLGCACGLGKCVSGGAERMQHAVSQSSRSFILEIFSKGEGDNCQCACSPRSGCTGAALFVRGLYVENPLYVKSGSISDHMQWLHSVVGNLQDLWYSLLPQLIRSTLFHEMEMRHTCYLLKDTWDTPADAESQEDREEKQDIREEEAEYIAFFETVLVDMLDDFNSSNLKLWEWLEQRFKKKLAELTKPDGPPDAEYIRAVEALSVHLEATHSSDEDSLSSLPLPQSTESSVDPASRNPNPDDPQDSCETTQLPIELNSAVVLETAEQSNPSSFLRTSQTTDMTVRKRRASL